MSVATRCAVLEKRKNRGPLVACFLFDENWEPLSPEEEEVALAKAEAEAGPDGNVMAVRLEEDWRK